jgi:AcrR family transcriptional regulator
MTERGLSLPAASFGSRRAVNADAAAASGRDAEGPEADWHRRVVGRSLRTAQLRSIDRGNHLIRAAAKVLERTNGESLTVQDVADEAGQSLRTLYQYFASKDDLLLAVYEEAMRTYAKLVRSAVAELDDPLERLAGAVVAAARMPSLRDAAGVDRGLTRLRTQVGQSDPDLVARSQVPMTALYRELLDDVVAAGWPMTVDVEPATYLLSSARTSFIVSATLGNEYSVELPDVIDLSVYCLAGLGLDRPRAWHEAIEDRLALSGDGRTILRRLASRARQ